MPITARLSHTLHATLGDDAASDLVDWMNAAETHRSELRELNELNFQRLDSRIDAFEHKVNGRFETFELRVNGRFEALEQRVNGRFEALEQTVNARFEAFEQKLDSRIGALRHDMRADLADLRATLIKWCFVFWCGTFAAAALWRR